jgi:DNA helicase HerA-like ATPase
MGQYPWVPWSRVSTVVHKIWDTENLAHHSIIGLTGSGKSYLAVKGILEMRRMDKVLIIDTKGDDESTSYGKVVNQLPRASWYQSLQHRDEERPYSKWLRIIAPDDRQSAHDKIGAALDQAYDEGDWTVFIDECAEVCDPQGREGLGLNAMMSKLWRKGRYRGVSVVAATQAPVGLPRLFFDQASFAWIGRIRDEERQRRLLEIGGMSRKDLSIISTLERRQWLLAADNGELFARTMVN